VSGGALLDLWREALTTLAMVAAPLLIVALGVGLVISIVQAATPALDSPQTISRYSMRFGISTAARSPCARSKWPCATLASRTMRSARCE